MTNGSSDSSDRLDRIENALDRFIDGLEGTKAIVNSNSRAIQATSANLDQLTTDLQETKAIVNSNSRSIQAIIEQRATDRLQREEEKAENEKRIRLLEQTQRELVKTSSGIARLLAAMDEDRPTILRRLMTIENKVDRILSRESE